MNIENHIAPFLSRKRKCILPGVGQFSLHDEEPVFDQASQVIHPPVTTVNFREDAGYSTEFEDYVARQENISVPEAANAYRSFSDSLFSLKQDEEFTIPLLGAFFADGTGKLRFRQAVIRSYRQAVPAIRVVHPEASHAILVGDRESDSVEMTELLHHDEDPQRSKWWIAAIVILLASLAAIFIHYSKHDGFGNNRKVSPAPEPETYTTPGR